jgi:hypothetical protein
MLRMREKPPLMLYLVWQNYTMLSKEVTSATMFGPSIQRTIARRQGMLEEEFAEHPARREAAITELTEAMSLFDAAQEPDDLLG